MMSTEQRQMLQWRKEVRHRTELIAENQPLDIPSFCTRANLPKTKFNVSVYYCILLVVHSFTLHTVKTESEVYY